jgi:hypothetical protein
MEAFMYNQYEDEVKIEKRSALRQLDDLIETAEDLRREIENAEEVENPMSEFENNSLKMWKMQVLEGLPNGSSLKMRQDVEEFLDNIKIVY